MSHSHEDRVADRPAHLCAAYGCPLLGVASTSTAGGSDWWCALHFGREAGAMQTITSAIRRVDWLAQAITDIRKFPLLTRPEQAAEIERLRQVFEQNGRADLFSRGAAESVRRWINRIEPELFRIIGEDLALPVNQPMQNRDTWAKASDNIPNFA